ncbi:MAG: MJ1477/TM1410 family putative glycoside hydrolase, partial [candidate division WOR-3 bacterium]
IFFSLALALACSGQETVRPDWQDVSSWVYQLQPSESQSREDFISDIAGTGFNLAVIDYSYDGTADEEFTTEEIDEIQSSGKFVLCYISIGEAEDYRWYWNPSWDSAPPDWLGPENPEWPGNYLVKYWDPGWKAIVFQYLRKLQTQGFDGFYLDSYEDFQDSIPWAQDSMKALVRAIADSFPGFFIVPQNASDLLQDPAYLSVIDGTGNEDVYYMDDDPQDPSETERVVSNLRTAKAGGKLVLIVDYCRQPEHIEDLYQKARSEGFVPYSTVRDLDSLVINPQDP